MYENFLILDSCDFGLGWGWVLCMCAYLNISSSLTDENPKVYFPGNKTPLRT